MSKSAREMAKKAQTTAAEQARGTVIPAVTGAAQQAKEKLGPRLETTKARVSPALEELGPALSAALAAAAAASEPYRDEAKRRGDAAVAALRGEVEPPKSKHRIRKLLIALGVGAAVAAAYKWFKSREAADEWEQAYQPTSARAVPDSDVSAGEERPDESLFSDKAAEGAASADKVPDPVEAVEESTAITPPEHTVETVTDEAEGATGTAPAASSDGAAAKSAPKPRTRRKRTT